MEPNTFVLPYKEIYGIIYEFGKTVEAYNFQKSIGFVMPDTVERLKNERETINEYMQKYPILFRYGLGEYYAEKSSSKKLPDASRVSFYSGRF